MNPKPRRFSKSAVLFSALATAAVVRAHPGHDGHELTWDLQHWAEHPLTTAAWLAVAGAVVWTAWRFIRRASAGTNQSLRGSQPSRGK